MLRFCFWRAKERMVGITYEVVLPRRVAAITPTWFSCSVYVWVSLPFTYWFAFNTPVTERFGSSS